jgi:hypothetical protein
MLPSFKGDVQLYELLFATVVKGQSNQYLWVVGRMKSWLLRLEQPKGRRYCRRVVAVGRQRELEERAPMTLLRASLDAHVRH